MMDVQQQIDKIIQEQLKAVNISLAEAPEGAQKEFIKDAIKNLESERTLDPMKFVQDFAKIKGDSLDIDKLKNIVKNHNNGH